MSSQMRSVNFKFKLHALLFACFNCTCLNPHLTNALTFFWVHLSQIFAGCLLSGFIPSHPEQTPLMGQLKTSRKKSLAGTDFLLMGQAEWQWFEHFDGDLQSFYLFRQHLWAEESLNVKERDGKPSVRGVGQMGRLEEGWLGERTV